jgi:hypothetical protein
MLPGPACSNDLLLNSANSAGKGILTMISVKYPCEVSSYSSNYDSNICIGELIRNLCVNLNIDPDTKCGYTENIRVLRMNQSGSYIHWEYNPNCSILKALTESERAVNTMHLAFELHDKHCS